jgi:hypothetical protein
MEKRSSPGGVVTLPGVFACFAVCLWCTGACAGELPDAQSDTAVYGTLPTDSSATSEAGLPVAYVEAEGDTLRAGGPPGIRHYFRLPATPEDAGRIIRYEAAVIDPDETATVSIMDLFRESGSLLDDGRLYTRPLADFRWQSNARGQQFLPLPPYTGGQQAELIAGPFSATAEERGLRLAPELYELLPPDDINKLADIYDGLTAEE